MRRTGVWKKKKEKSRRDLERCGSAALEERNRWIGSLVGWGLTLADAFPPVRLDGQPKIPSSGPRDRWVGGCGLWVVGCDGLRCADDDSFLREAGLKTSTPFLAPLPPP